MPYDTLYSGLSKRALSNALDTMRLSAECMKHVAHRQLWAYVRSSAVPRYPTPSDEPIVGIATYARVIALREVVCLGARVDGVYRALKPRAS